jgi:hypothetical protein
MGLWTVYFCMYWFISVCTGMYLNKNCVSFVALLLEFGDARTRHSNYSMLALYCFLCELLSFIVDVEGYCCLYHTEFHIHILGRTPLNEISARCRSLYLYNSQHSQETTIHAPGVIRTRNPNHRTDADLRFRPRVWDSCRFCEPEIKLYLSSPNHLLL